MFAWNELRFVVIAVSMGCLFTPGTEAVTPSAPAGRSLGTFLGPGGTGSMEPPSRPGRCEIAGCGVETMNGGNTAAFRSGPGTLGIAGGGALKTGKVSLEALVPGDGDVDGWKRDGEMRLYDPMNLWEYIDGSAEMFLEYDFEGLAVQDFISKEGKALKVEIYRHADSLDAFGIYSMCRDPSAEPLDLGGDAFSDGYCLHVWKGRYYVHVCVFEEDTTLKGALVDFGGLVAGRIGEGGGLPRWVDSIPSSFGGGVLVRRSLSYVRGGVMGRGWYPPAFSVEYMKEGSEEAVARLYISNMGDEGKASRVVERFLRGVSGGGRLEDVSDPGIEVYSADDRYSGRLFIAESGGWVFLCSGFDGDEGTFVEWVVEFLYHNRL